MTDGCQIFVLCFREFERTGSFVYGRNTSVLLVQGKQL